MPLSRRELLMIKHTHTQKTHTRTPLPCPPAYATPDMIDRGWDYVRPDPPYTMHKKLKEDAPQGYNVVKINNNK